MKSPGIYPKEPEFSELVDPQSKVEMVAEGFGATAGPVFSRIGFLLFSDAEADRIYRWEKPATSGRSDSRPPAIFRASAGGAIGLTFDHQGRLLACESAARRVTRTEKDGSITVRADRCEGNRFERPGDLIYAIDGSVYFCDVGAQVSTMPGDSAGPGVYRISRSQVPGAAEVERVSRECKHPTGVALGPKQDRLFVADADTRTIRVHAIRDDGSLEPGRVAAEFESDEPGLPGGLKTDERGNLYAAGPGGLWVFSSLGKPLGTIVLPEQPTNCCWGAGFSGLFITAGRALYYVPTRIPGTRTY